MSSAPRLRLAPTAALLRCHEGPGEDVCRTCRLIPLLAALIAAIQVTATVSLVGQEPAYRPSLAASIGVEYIDKPYEVRTGIALALPFVGPLDLYPSVYRWVDPIAIYDEVWQMEANLRVRLTGRTAPVVPYVGGGIAVQPAFAALAAPPPPDQPSHANVFGVALAGVELTPRSSVRPVVEVQMVGTGPNGDPGYGGGEVAVLAGLSLTLGHDPASGDPGPLAVCTSGAPVLPYDDCSLRVKHTFLSTRLVQGRDETVAARFTFLAPPLTDLMQRSDSAWDYYWIFHERYNRGFWYTMAGSALFLGGTILYAADQDRGALSATFVVAGFAFHLAGIINAARAREPLSKAIWWYNRSLREPDP